MANADPRHELEAVPVELVGGVAAPPITSVPAESSMGDTPDDKPNVLSRLPPFKKNVLLVLFVWDIPGSYSSQCLSIFIDGAGTSSMFLMTEPIARDLGITLSNEAWIPGSYAMTFAATLLFAGRLADLYPPDRVYTIGYMGLGVLYLIISFMPNQYAFFTLRAISALLAVLTIPSSINMIIQMFPDSRDQTRALSWFSMSGALATSLAPVLVGAFLISSWRWWFRFIAIVAVPFAVAAWLMMPRTEAVVKDVSGKDKWKRMDLGGVFLLVAALVLFCLAFTQAGIVGWKSALFIAPLLVSLVVLLPAFLLWEHHMPKGYSLLPPDIWSIPNLFPMMLQASVSPFWFSTYQLRCATYFQSALGDSAILTAAKLLPMGVTGVIAGVLSVYFPAMVTKPRFVQPLAGLLVFGATMLLAFSGGGWGKDYFRFILPGEFFGTFGGMTIFIGMNTCIIQSFPVEYAGVGGSFANVIFQVGGVIGIAIQAGIQASSGSHRVEDWTGDRNGYLFVAVYVLLAGLVFLVLYRPPRKQVEADTETASKTLEDV